MVYWGEGCNEIIILLCIGGIKPENFKDHIEKTCGSEDIKHKDNDEDM